MDPTDDQFWCCSGLGRFCWPARCSRLATPSLPFLATPQWHDSIHRKCLVSIVSFLFQTAITIVSSIREWHLEHLREDSLCLWWWACRPTKSNIEQNIAGCTVKGNVDFSPLRCLILALIQNSCGSLGGVSLYYQHALFEKFRTSARRPHIKSFRQCWLFNLLT